MIRSAVLRNDLAPIPVTLEADIRVDDATDRQLAQDMLITAAGSPMRIIKATKTVGRAAQGDHGQASTKIIAVLDACRPACFVRDRPITKERTTLAAIYRAAGATIQAVEGDFEAPRFSCLVGDTPTFGIARLLQQEGGVVRWKAGRLRFFRLADLFGQKPILDLPNNACDDVDSGFQERHQVPWFYSTAADGSFVYGDRSKARAAVFSPNTDARQLRNMTRCLVRRKVTKINYAGQLCAGDLINFQGGEQLAIITAAHVFETGTDDGGAYNTYTKLWLGKLSAGKFSG